MPQAAPAVNVNLPSSAPPAPVGQLEQSVADVSAHHAGAVMSQYSAVTNATEPAFNKVLTSGHCIMLHLSTAKEWTLHQNL